MLELFLVLTLVASVIVPRQPERRRRKACALAAALLLILPIWYLQRKQAASSVRVENQSQLTLDGLLLQGSVHEAYLAGIRPGSASRYSFKRTKGMEGFHLLGVIDGELFDTGAAFLVTPEMPAWYVATVGAGLQARTKMKMAGDLLYHDMRHFSDACQAMRPRQAVESYGRSAKIRLNDIRTTLKQHVNLYQRMSLSSPELKKEWMHELSNIRERIKEMRKGLVAGLLARGKDAEFDFIHQQTGMFSYSGLTPDQVHRLRQDYGIYMTQSGRINIAGLNWNNLDYVINAMVAVHES